MIIDPMTPESCGITVEPDYEHADYRNMRGARYYRFRNINGDQFVCDEGTIHNCVTRAGKTEEEADKECEKLYGHSEPVYQPDDNPFPRPVKWIWPLPHEIATNSDWNKNWKGH